MRTPTVLFNSTWPTWFQLLRVSRLCAAGLLASTAYGQASTSPVTEADIERARRSQPTITEQDIERARRRHAAPLIDPSVDQASPQVSPQPPSTPRLDALPQPASRAVPELGAIAGGFKADGQSSSPTLGVDSSPTLLIFVSFAIPEVTLKRLVDQAAAAGATLVLRGMVDGSLRATAARVQQLLGKRQIAMQMDPRLFDRYAIDATPSFVLVRGQSEATSSDPDGQAPCTAGRCAPTNSFVAVAGDVSLDFALKHLAHSAPAFGREAGFFLKRLRASPHRQGGR